MRTPLLAAALAGSLAGCMVAGPARAPDAAPPPGQAVEAEMAILRDGAPFASQRRTLWRGRENRFGVEGDGWGVEFMLRPEFNLAGEFWGGLAVAEYEVLEDGTRVHHLGAPSVFDLDPTVTRRWSVAFPGRAGEYRVELELDYGFALKSELLLRGD